MAKWLAKTEADVFSIDDLRREKKTIWDGVRNYQARNFLRDMAAGEEVFIYHSNADPPGIAGIAVVDKTAAADPTQFDPKSDYFDPKATRDNPRWFAPVFRFQQKFADVVPLAALRRQRALAEMLVLRRGQRLSVMPVTDAEWKAVMKLALP